MNLPEATKGPRSLGEYLCHRRERFPMSMDDLVRASGVSKAAISQLETGYSLGRADTLSRLEQALGLPVHALQLRSGLERMHNVAADCLWEAITTKQQPATAGSIGWTR